MSRCHNCGRETMRTEDWACQWCGYPLVSGSFKKIEKTYRQLKEERLGRPAEEPVPGPEPEPESEERLESIEAPEFEEEPEEEKQQEEREEAVSEPEPKEETIQEPESESVTEQEIKMETGVPAEAEAVVEEEEDSAEIAVEIEKEKEPAPEPEPELEKAAEELNVTEIFKAYEEDDIAADERFVDKILRITGVVSLVDAKNVSDTHYIRLAASEGDLMQSVQCMFAKKHASSLSQLEKGQVVTVQGRYNGSVIAMRMVDCVLIV
jgi:hypothetical protein